MIILVGLRFKIANKFPLDALLHYLLVSSLVFESCKAILIPSLLYVTILFLFLTRWQFISFLFFFHSFKKYFCGVSLFSSTVLGQLTDLFNLEGYDFSSEICFCFELFNGEFSFYFLSFGDPTVEMLRLVDWSNFLLYFLFFFLLYFLENSQI